jgi:endoglucanase
VLGSCGIGVSAPRLNPDGTPAPRTYCPRGTWVPKEGLIDDYQDGNTMTFESEGRGGYWYTSADSAGSTIGPEELKPVAEGTDGNSILHVFGETVTGDPSVAWGVQLGGNFTQGDPYDASKYVGIRFRAKRGDGATPSVRFKVADLNTEPAGGNCTQCYNHFGQDLSLNPDWTQYEFFFGSMQQRPYWGDPRPASIAPKQLYGLNFSVEAGAKFDFSIDDLEFFACR